MEMELSIIIPMYNAENTITKCIESIEVQEVNFDFEIIVVDDGSVDSSVIMVKDMIAEYNNIVLLRQQNLKQSEARNNGLKHAKGKYVMFFDCDDNIESGMLKKMVKTIEGNELAMCGIKKIFSNRIVIENKTALNNAENKRELIINYLTKNKEFDVGLWNKIFKLDVIRNNGLYFENGNFFEDSLFVLKYLCFINFDKVKFIDEAFYNLYKRNGKSTTTKFDFQIDHLAHVYVKKVCSFLKELSVSIPDEAFVAFEIRIVLHVIHHHIKYDDSWSSRLQRRKMSFVSVRTFFRALKFLNSNYRFASIVARYYPSIYIKMYLENK